MPADARCIRCRCTDSMACPDGCGWIVVDRRRRIGICSNCHRGQSIAQLQRAVRDFARKRRERRARAARAKGRR